MGSGGARMSLRLKETSATINGHVYPLRCNMSVLERLQDEFGDGEIGNLYKMQSYKVIFAIMKTMLDDACEDNPDLPVIEMKQLKKMYSPSDLGEMGIFKMFVLSMDVLPEETRQLAEVSGSDTDNKPGTPEPSGN